MYIYTSGRCDIHIYIIHIYVCVLCEVYIREDSLLRLLTISYHRGLIPVR